MGHPIIMGRKTFESIGRPLPGRSNIVATRRACYEADGIDVVHDLETARRTAQDIASRDGVDEIMVIGGAEIYAMALPLADRLYLTEVQCDAVGDVCFPAFDVGDWRECSRESHARQGDTPGFDFVVLDRVREVAY